MIGDAREVVAQVGFRVEPVKLSRSACTSSQREHRRCPNLRTDNSYDPEQSRGYSAHIGQEVEIHYRWHALYGRPVRRYYGEKRGGADVVVVEGEPGAAIVVAAWMLDPAACLGMKIGAPHVSVEVLVDLHRLLTECGLPDDVNVVQEARNEKRVTTDDKVQARLVTFIRGRPEHGWPPNEPNSIRMVEGISLRQQNEPTVATRTEAEG